MAFPTGWGRQCELKIQASKVSANLSNFPVLLTVTTLPSEMFDADGPYPALAGGGDIRFSSDAAGTNRLACEVVTFLIDNNPNNGSAEIYVNVASVSSSVDTSIWLWYNKTGESQPGEGDAYGKHATWDDGGSDYFKLVQHLNEDPTSNGIQAIDSTQYSNDGDSRGSMTSGDLVTGAFAGGTSGDAWDFDGTDDSLVIPAQTYFNQAPFTASVWTKWDVLPSSKPEHPLIVGKMHTGAPYSSWRLEGDKVIDKAQLRVNDDGAGTHIVWANDALVLDTWYYIVGTLDSSYNMKLYVDGILQNDIENAGSIYAGDRQLYIARRMTADEFDGIIDEVRFSSVTRSADWISACYNSQNDPSAFVIEQTPQGFVEHKLEGVTKDKTGTVLGSCKCYLFKDNLDDTLIYVDYVLSDAGTGAYSFTGIYDDVAQYIVVAWKDDTPHVFDTTDHVLQPVAV